MQAISYISAYALASITTPHFNTPHSPTERQYPHV
jgi:hypothetical protein